MATLTTRGALIKPVDGEAADVAIINANSDKLSLYAMGAFICTSTTRPALPWDGMLIKETDTKSILSYDTAAVKWQPIYFDSGIVTANAFDMLGTWVPYTASGWTGVTAQKIGNIVIISGAASKGTAWSVAEAIFNMKPGWRPVSNAQGMGGIPGNVTTMYTLDSSGNFKISTGSGAGGAVSFTCTYVAI